MAIWTWLSKLTFVHAIIIAVVAIVLGMTLLTRGIGNMLTWIVALGAIITAAINYLSYNRG